MPGLLVCRPVFDGTPVVDLAVIGFTSARPGHSGRRRRKSALGGANRKQAAGRL